MEEKVELPKSYADGKVILKEPTVKDMTEVAPILQRAGAKSVEGEEEALENALIGKGLLKILKIVCDGEEEDIEGLHPETAEEVFRDFFFGWEPTKFGQANTQTLIDYTDSLRNGQMDTETSEES